MNNAAELFLDTGSGQLGLFDEAEEYGAFVEKFKPKLTTDDCYTPPRGFDTVASWVSAEYSLDPTAFVRPFFPGMDYVHFSYPEGCVVVDNPPFSLRAQIVDFYIMRRIRYFLFSPALTLLTHRQICHIAVGVPIVYENGAEVPTSFVTNLEDCVLRTAPDLYSAVSDANAEVLKNIRKVLPKYEYPDNVITAAIAQRWCRYGVEYRLQKEDCIPIRALDAQRDVGKAIFGSGYLLSGAAAAEKAAAEKAAAEKAAAKAWPLSPRELALVSSLRR